ncbi:MAG TPA: 3-hydroxyacyl-CoA dehydrogenase family protein [Prolixibacteraceae bacterium]|nr:3-hydroxyacyl-CoA dehydrogenase family protein [Prolixibacteraceae bacterium]
MSQPVIEPISEFGLTKKKKKTRLFSKVGIVCCENDGQYIARVCSSYGMEVIFWEITPEKIDWSLRCISDIMESRIRNWGATESEKKAVMSRIRGTTRWEDLKDCDLVIETVSTTSIGRSLDARQKVFERLESIVDPSCIIATNSTTVIISELSENLKHKDRCISIHFMINSVDSRIVEITKGLYTSVSTFEKVKRFISMINRKSIPVEESVGLISIRMFTVILNEACEIVLEGIGTIDDIEQLMQTGYGMRYGPFSVADIMGLERVARWMENLFNEFGDARFKPNPLIKKLLRQHHYGVASGQGFFKYGPDGERIDTTEQQ